MVITTNSFHQQEATGQKKILVRSLNYFCLA